MASMSARPKPFSLPSRQRPLPPEEMPASFLPAPEVQAWIRAQIFAEDGALHNPDHKHLLDADLAVLWAHEGFESKGRTVIGQAEELMFRCNRWQRGRQEQQMAQWFGRVPEYLLTFDASYSAKCSDIEWCALVEHELYHVAQKRDDFGAPAFTKDGRPKLGIVAHDVEEFVGVVRRYGPGSAGGNLARLIEAGKSAPEVGRVAIAGACGTCLLRVA